MFIGTSSGKRGGKPRETRSADGKKGAGFDKFREARFTVVPQAKLRMTDVNAVKDKGQSYD